MELSGDEQFKYITRRTIKLFVIWFDKNSENISEVSSEISSVRTPFSEFRPKIIVSRYVETAKTFHSQNLGLLEILLVNFKISNFQLFEFQISLYETKPVG